MRPSALLKHEAQPAANSVSGLALGFDRLPGLPSSRSTTPSSLRTRPPRPPWALAAVVYRTSFRGSWGTGFSSQGVVRGQSVPTPAGANPFRGAR